MKKIMVIFGILAMVWFQSCQTPYNNIDLENENGNTVTEQTNGENQNDNGNNEDSNNEENGQDENQQAEHVCKDYFEIEVGEDWTTFEYTARDMSDNTFYNDVGLRTNESNYRFIDMYAEGKGAINYMFKLELNDNEDKVLFMSVSNKYEVYDVIKDGNTVELQFRTK